MNVNPSQVGIYHITHVDNLPSILRVGGLKSDASMQQVHHIGIGYQNIKHRRLNKIQVDCCGSRYVGDFVPFYFCPRSPMLYVINQGNTSLPPGGQSQIVHLVSTVAKAIAQNRLWAISGGNASASHTWFSNNLGSLGQLNWQAINASQWQGMIHEKQAEFLVADFFDWSAIHEVACFDQTIANRANLYLATHSLKTSVNVRPNWYF
jgi:hypothetical protein